MQTTSTPSAVHTGPVLSAGGQFQRTLCSGCGRVFGTSAEQNQVGTASCPSCKMELSLGDPIRGTVLGNAVARYGGAALPPPPPRPVAPPVQKEIEERIGFAERTGPDEKRFPFVLALVSGVGLLTVSSVIFAAVLTFLVWQRPSAAPEKEDLVTEIQLSDAERSQAELDRTKEANRRVQNELMKLESQSRTLENELNQLRKSVL